MRLKRFLDITCMILLTSSVMDTYFWLTTQYHVPCWTIAVISTATIALLQVLKRLI